MTTFDKREEGFEKQFAHDEDLKFKATARRNKLLGLWAAEKLGMTGADADAYAKEVVMAEFEAGGDTAVLNKVRKDFEAKGVAQSEDPDWSDDDEAISVAGCGADQGWLIAAAMRSSTCATSAAISFARTSITR